MIKTNQDIIGEQWIRINDDVLAATDEDKKTAEKIISNSELVIQILDRRVTPAEWNLSTLNC